MANVKVAVRVRPLCKREEDAKATIVVNEYQENVLGVSNPKIEGIEGGSDHRDRIKHFSFDYCYFSLDKTAPNYASQQTIFNDLGSEILDSSFDGYNVCLFAYGQTGSGKTYTMMGDEADQGVIPRLCESLLGRISSYEEDVTFKVEVSFLEIYNERVRDLLAPPNKAKYSLKVREHPKDGPYVQDLSHHLVSDYEQVLSLMHDGNLQRTTAATHMHELSSRSHAIFTITFIQAKMTHGIPSEIVSKINLVDLAGSERASINSSKDRLQEGANINKSLVTLGNCIQALGPTMDLSKSLPETWLTSRQKRAADSALIAASMESLSMSEDWDAPSGPRRRTNYVPYRNSILTWLLKDSLGGNSKTIMIATISPASIHYNETMSTLRYARRAKHIVNQPIINEDRNVRLIRELRAEIDRLRMLLNSASLASSQASLIQDQNICRMLQENEQRVDQLTEAWVEKWSNAARIMQECNVGIRKESVGVIVESELPHLIGMDDDLLSTGIILYHLKEGRTKIGRENPDNHQDIVLYGPEVEDEHAVIINTDGHVVLTPLRNSKCAVNGINIHRPIELTQGAVILLGSTNMFRFNHPAEAVKLRERRASKIPGRGLRRKSVTLHVPNSGEALSAEFGKRISLSMSLDGSWSAEPESNLKKTPMRSSFSDLSSDISPIMMFNPGLELERRHKLEAEKLADTKKQLAELEARRAEAEAAQQEQESMMQRSLREHQERIREQKELIERLKKEHQEAMAQAQEELALMKGKINSQKEIGKQKLEGELTQLKEVPSYHSDLCTIPSVVSNACTDAGDLSGLDIARKRVALMELLQKQSQRKALAALERRQATLEVQERTAQLILKHEEQKLQDFETDPRLLEGEFGPEQLPEKELGERDIENTVDSSTENVSTELPASGRVSPVGNSDPETVHNNNLHSPRREAKCIQKLENKGQIIDQKKDQSNSKKSSRKSDSRPARKVELGTPKPKPREEQIKRESNGRSASPARSSSSSKSSRSSSPSKSSRSNSPAKSLRSDSPSKSLRSDSPTKSLRSDSPTKSSRSSSPASTTSRRSRQTSGDVFSRLYPQQETKFDYLRKKSPPRYGEYDPHRERHRDSPHLIRRELSPLSHDPIKLKDRNRENVQDHKHGRTSSVPSSNLPERTKQNLHSRSRSASPCVNKPVKPVTRPKKSPVLPSSQEAEKAGRRAKAKSKDIASVPHVRSQSNPVKEKENNKCQTKTKRAQQTTPKESTTSSPTKRKANHPEKTLNAKTPKSSPVSPSRSRPVSSKALDRNPSPRKKSDQTPSHRKTVKRPLSSSRNGKDGENASSPSPRRKFARTPVVKPKNWPSMENLPKSTPKSEAFYVPLTSEQLRLELQKHASEQDSGPHLEGADLGASGCEQHWSPSRKRSVGKRPEQTQTDPIQDGIGEEISDFKIGGGNDSDNEENFSSSSESFIDSLEEDLECDQNNRAEVDLEHDSGPRVVDMTSADEDEFWAIPVSSEDILTASSDEGEDDDDEDDIALNLDVHGDRKQSSDTLESVNSNDELEADDPCHSTLVQVENPEADVDEEQGSAYPETDTNDRRLENDERRSSGDSLGSDQFPPDQIVSYHEEAKPSRDNSCSMKRVDNEQVHVPLEMQRQEEITEGVNTGDIPDLDDNQDRPSEAEIEAYKRCDNNSVSEIDLSGTEEESPTVGIHDGTDQSPQGPCHNENQSRMEYEVSPESPIANVTCEQEIVGPTAKEAEACKTDEEDNVSGEHVKTGHEIPQFDNSDTSDSLPQEPHTDETYSMPDLPSEDLSSELSLPNVKIDKEINEPSDEQESCEVPERNEQKTTEQSPPIEHAEVIDQEPQHELHSDGVLSLEDLPNECAVAAPSHHDAISESELDRPTQEMEIMKDDIIENPEENRLKCGEENPSADDSYSTDQLPQESHTKEILSSTDLLEGDSISSSPLHPDISYEEETCGPRGEREALENDRIDNDPERLKMAEEGLQIGMSDVNDPVLQEALFKIPLATDLCNEHPSCSDAVQPIVSFEKGAGESTEKIEVGKEDEPGKFPERNDHRSTEEEPQVNINARSDIPEEQSDNEIHPMSGLPSGDSTSSVSSHPDFTCDSAMEGSLIKGDTTLCKEDGEDVPPKSEFETSEEDIHIENSDACDQLHEGEPHIDGNHTMPDLHGEETPLEQFHLDVKDAACDKPTGNHDIIFISKPDSALDPKAEGEVPSFEENIDHHLEMSSFEASQESHPGISTPEEFISKDLEPSSMHDDDIETSVQAEEGEPSGDGSDIAIPIKSPEDQHQSKKEVEMNGYAHGDNPHQSECEGVRAEPSADGNTVSTDKETANNEAALVFSPCPAEDKESSLDITDQAPNDLVRLNENMCVSLNDDENISQKDASDDQETATTADSTSSPMGCSNNAPLQGHRNEQDADSVFADSAMPDQSTALKISCVKNCPISAEKQDQNEAKDEEQLPEEAMPLIAVQSEADEIPAVSCTVMANQLNQLQRPVIVNLSTVEQDSSDYDEGSSDLVSYDQSQSSEEEMQSPQESLPDEESQPPEKSVGENKEQQKPVSNDKNTKEILSEQEPVTSDETIGDKVKVRKSEEVQPETTNIPKMNIFSNTKSDEYPANQQFQKPHGNGERKAYPSSHNFRITRASPVPFSDEEMESMESPSSCSSPSAAEYHFDEEQTLSDFLEDVNEVDEEEAAMSDDVSALQNSEVNDEKTDGSHDSGTDNTPCESEIRLGIPEALQKGKVPSIQSSLPPNVYKSLFNADSPLKQNILANSTGDGTLPDESALYQSAVDTSLYQTAVESPSAFSNKNEIDPLKKTWQKDQILAYSTPTGTPEGTPARKMSENPEKQKFCPSLIDQLGGSPSVHKCRVLPQLDASQSPSMARKIPVSPTDLQGNVVSDDASAISENIPIVDNSVCMGDICTDRKSGSTFCTEFNGRKDDNEKGEETKGLYRSPHDLPEQSYILHTLETIQEEDSQAEVSESEDTCSTLHSNSPQNSRETSPDVDHMSVSSKEDVNHDSTQDASLMEELTCITKVPVDEDISKEQPSGISQRADQEVISEGNEGSQSIGNDLEPSADQSHAHLIKSQLREDELPLPENSVVIKQETIPTNVDGAVEQDDVVSEAAVSNQPRARPMKEMTPGDNEEVLSTMLPSSHAKTDNTHSPEVLMGMHESTADDVENTEEMPNTVLDFTEKEPSVELLEASPRSKNNDVFSRLYPKNVPKFDFTRKSGASVIPKGRSFGNVSPKIKRKDLKAKKADMFEDKFDGDIHDKKFDAEGIGSEDDVGGESLPASAGLLNTCDKSNEADIQQHDILRKTEVCEGEPAVAPAGDCIPETILESEPADNSLKDPINDVRSGTGAKNEMDFHEDDDTKNKSPSLSPHKYSDAHESQAVENLKPFLGKDYAVASAKLTMFMRMFGLSVESTDSSESSDSLRMHRDRGLVDRIVGDGVGYDPDTLTNSLSGSPGSIGHKEGETVPDGDESADQTWTGSDVAVDGDSSIRELRSRSTTASDAELMSGGDDAMTNSTSAMSLHNMEEDQKLETISKYPTTLPRMQPESCITRSMQLAYPTEAIAHTLNKLDIGLPRSIKSSMEEDANIDRLSASSFPQIGEQNNLTPDIREIPEIDFSDETKAMESCKERDHNHNVDSLEELKRDLDEPASPYNIDDSILTSPSSVANQEDHVQIQELVMTPSKLSAGKHPDVSSIEEMCEQSRTADEPYPSADEDEGRDDATLSAEAEGPLIVEAKMQESVPHLTPRVTEVIHASMVQLEENEISSIQGIKDLFAKIDETPNNKESGLDEESGPSTEVNATKEGETESPLRYVEVNDSSVNFKIERDDWKPMQRQVSEKIAVDRVQLAEISLPTLFEKMDESYSSHEVTEKESSGSEPQQNDNLSVHSQSKVKLSVHEEDEAVAGQDLVKPQIREICKKEPTYLPEHSLPAILSKLDASEVPFSHQRSLSESKSEDTHGSEQDDESQSSAPEELERQKTLGENNSQPEPDKPVSDISNQHSNNLDHDHNRFEQPVGEGNEGISTKELPKIQVNETWSKHPIHLPEHSMPAMLSKLGESAEPLSRQSSSEDSKTKDLFTQEEKDEEDGDSKPSAIEGEAQQRGNHLEPKAEAVVFDGNPRSRNANDADDHEQMPTVMINPKKDQGVNTDDVFVDHVKGKMPADKNAIPVAQILPSAGDISAKDQSSHHVTTKEVSDASCGSIDELTQPACNSDSKEPKTQLMPFRKTAQEEPILVEVAYPSSDEPVKWHLLSTDSSKGSTCSQSSRDSAAMVNPAVDKSTQCQPAEMAKGLSKDNLDLLVPHEREDKSTSPAHLAESLHSFRPTDFLVPHEREDKSTSPTELADSLHSFKPITPSPRHIIAAAHMDTTLPHVKELGRDSTVDTPDIDSKEHEHPSKPKKSSEWISSKAILHKETQSDFQETTSSLHVPPLQTVGGLSPAYSPLLSSRSTDDELAQIFAAAKQKASIKHTFTNTSPEIQVAQRSIADASTTTDDSLNNISNGPVQDLEEIPSTASAQTSPVEVLIEQRSVLDASTATDDTPKPSSNDPVQDIDGITSAAYAETSQFEESTATACMQTSPFEELGNSKDYEVSYQNTATETMALTPPYGPKSVADTDDAGNGDSAKQLTCDEECMSGSRSISTSPIVQPDFNLSGPGAENHSPLNIKTSTPNIASVSEQESQVNLNSQSNSQECQTDPFPSGPSSPSSTEDDASGPWRKASEVLDELSGNMDAEELELFAVLMHKRRLSEQTVDRVKGLVAKLRKHNQSHEPALLTADLRFDGGLSPNPSSATNAEEGISSLPGVNPDVLGGEIKCSPPARHHGEETEEYSDQNSAVLMLSPLPLSETGTREFDFGDIRQDTPATERSNQPLTNYEQEISMPKGNLQPSPLVDDEFMTVPGQNGSISPPLVSALEQSKSPRSGLPFDRKPTPPTKTQQEKPISDRPAAYSKVPVSHIMGTSSHNDWHSMPLQSTWDESLNRNNNSSTDYSEDDIGNGEVAGDILNEESQKQDSVGSKNSQKVTLSTFSDVSFDSELDFPVDTNDKKEGFDVDKRGEEKNQSTPFIHTSTQSLDSDLFADSAEPELLALQGDTDDSNALTGSLPVDFSPSTSFVGEETQGVVKDDQGEAEDKLNEAESFRINMPPISPAKLEWLLAESETEPDDRYLPLSKHPEKDKIPLPGFKHQNTEGPFVIEKQPNEELMQKLEGKIHPQHAGMEAYPVKFAMDIEQKGTFPPSSHVGPSARSRQVPGYANQVPLSSNQYPGVALPLAGNRQGNLDRTGSSLGESSGIYSLASEIPHQQQVKTPSESMDSLINAASTDEEKDMQQLQTEYERLLQGRNSSGLRPGDTPGPIDVQQGKSSKGSDDSNKISQPHSNGIMSGYSSGDSASSSEVDGFVYGHYSQSMDRRDISIELLEAQVMHGIGETDALLKFLDDDLPLEYWKNRKSQPKSREGEVEHRKPPADKREITHKPNTGSDSSSVYQFKRSPSASLRKSPSGPQSSRSSPSSVTPPPPQRVVTPLLRTSPREQSPSPRGRFKPSEHLKFLRRVRENVVKATANPTISPTPSSPSPKPQLYSLYSTEAPTENLRTSSFNMEKNDMELFLNELREARKMSQSEIEMAEKELHPSRRRYSTGEDNVFANDTHHLGGGDSRNLPAERDGDHSLKQRTQRSDEELIDREIASMRAAAAVIHPSTASTSLGTSPSKEDKPSMEETDGSPSKPYFYEMYDLPSRINPPCKSISQSRPQSQFGYSLYKDPPRSQVAFTKTYPPSTSTLQGDEPLRTATPLSQAGSIRLQKYAPLKSTGSSSSLPVPPNRRSTPQPSGVYLSVPQHRGVASPQGGESTRTYGGSPGSQVKISPVKSSLRNRRQHAGKPFQELPTVRESKLAWSRPECHLVAETALQTLVSEMAPLEGFDPNKSQQPDEEGGWRYEGKEQDILLLCKTHSPTSPINSYAGIGIIKAPARTVFNYVKNPTSRQLYDPMLKEVKMKKDFEGDLQVVYMVFKTDQCLLQHPRDCLCVIKTLEMDDRFLVVAASIKHPRIPPKKKTIRAEVLLAGCSIQPLQTGDMEHCRVTHLSQVNLHGDLQPKLINALCSRLPLCIADLRNIVQIGDV